MLSSSRSILFGIAILFVLSACGSGDSSGEAQLSSPQTFEANSAKIVTEDTLVVGSQIVLQDKNTGQWIRPQFLEGVGFLPTPVAGIADASIYGVVLQDGEIGLIDSLGKSWPTSLVSLFNAFEYESRTPTSYYVDGFEKQLQEIQNFNFERWDVKPNYGFDFGIRYHTQGIAILANGTWMQTQSAGGVHCDGVIQSINPITERDLVLHTWDHPDICDPHTSGIQAVGNVIAVGSGNSDADPDLRFYKVDSDGEPHLIPHLGFVVQKPSLLGPGFVYVEDVGYFLYVKWVGGGIFYFREDLDDTTESWKKIGGCFGKGACGSGAPASAESGVNLIMDANGTMYFISIGTNDEEGDVYRNGFHVKKIEVPSGSTTKDFWTKVSEGNYLPYGPSLGGLKAPLDVTLFAPFPPGSFFWHSFRWGGNFNINETGRLEILQPPRDFLNIVKDTAVGQANYVVLRSKTGIAVNPVTRGLITRVRSARETDDGPGSDEIYLATNFKKGPIQENIDEGDVWYPNFEIRSLSVEGTYVHLMEDDSGAVFGPRPEVIGQIFIPPAAYALPGAHEYKATLSGDGGKYEVTYQVIGGRSVNTPPTAAAGNLYYVLEGGAINLDGTASFDADGDALSYAWDLDNDGDFDDANGPTPSFSATSLDDGSYTVNLRVSDGMDFNDASATVTVVNVSPIITSIALINSAGITIGEDIGNALILLDNEISVSFVDAGILDTHTVMVDWGDGTVNNSAAANTFSDAHAYVSTGDYTIVVTVTDDDSGSIETSKTIKVVDAAGAVTDVIDAMVSYVNDLSQDSDDIALAQEALKELNGNQDGLAANGTLDMLAKGNWNAGLVKLLKAIEILEESGTDYSDTVAQLVLSAKSTIVELVEIANADATSENDWLKIANATALIVEGDLLFEAGDAMAAVEIYRSALSSLN